MKYMTSAATKPSVPPEKKVAAAPTPWASAPICFSVSGDSWAGACP
jgi:hypothetical protein